MNNKKIIRSCDVDVMTEVVYTFYINWVKGLEGLSGSSREGYLVTNLDHGRLSNLGFNTNKKIIKKYFEKDYPEKNIFSFPMDHRCTVDYFSEAALEALKKEGPNKKVENKTFYRYEHIVPKSKYIFTPIKEAAINGTLTKQKVKNLIDNYYYVACITAEEDRNLKGKLSNSMPDGWNADDDIRARYAKEHGNIKLIVNPLFSLMNE